MSVQVRQRVEKRILEATIDLILADPRGLLIEVDIGDGEEPATRDKAKLLESAYAGDEARLFLQTPDRRGEGWVYFVWGNSGWDCLSDYTTNLETLLGPVVSEGGLQEQMDAEFGDQ